MDVAELLGGGCAVVVAGVLLWAGLEKARAHRAFLSTLTALGHAPGWLRRSGAVAVPAAEVSTAVGLLLWPVSWLPRLGVVLLATAFAVAGGLGLHAPQPVRCSCLGFTGDGRLGRRQLAAFPVWIGAVLAIAAAPPAWSAGTGTAMLAGTVLTLGAVRAAGVERARRDASAARQALLDGTGDPIPMFTPVEVPR